MTFHPALILFATAGLVGLSRGRVRAALLLAGAIAALAAAASLAPGVHWDYAVGDYHLQLLRVDALSQLFGLIFTLIMVVGAVYALHATRAREHAATLVYAGGALGVVYAGDWVSAFAWWELMATASVVVVWSGGHRQRPRRRVPVSVRARGRRVTLLRRARRASVGWRRAHVRPVR